MLLIGDRPLEALLSSGKPFHLKTYHTNSGQDIALLLKTAFNLALAVEKKYADKLFPENKHLGLPPVEDVAWAHILANQHHEFDNVQVWLFARETQIFPRLEATIQQFTKYKETKELGFVYSVAMHQLLKCFTQSVELVDAANSTALLSACKETQGLLPSDEMTMEEVAVMAALSAGVDMILVEEQLPATSSLPFTHKFSSNQLEQIATLARPHFTIK
ncbi:hypothetical protein PsorP6_016443 [Peronosclerospora sorghi]|uniref:Uncharacterized protein n=1 Tax=Peronosclerospora sorghi TaxID=230839 RepID=A0ACC0VLW2_9STRA|nr:hypothetical protein PsorP6_016443 [Peronosclerospora sorghi]